MAFNSDPRSDTSPSLIRPSSCVHPHSNIAAYNAEHNNKRFSTLSLGSKPRVKPCYDWIFSSASNVHVAIDRCAFKEYTAFDSYVLTLAGGQAVSVTGVGTVELKIKRRPDTRDSHTIKLKNVLHIPCWMCNIFSDIFFGRGQNFEHEWTKFGVQLSVREKDKIRSWGHTEDFYSLDRLVLAKRHKDSRSPMLEDREREVFAVNVTWPQSQRDRWAKHLIEGGSPLSTYDLSQSSPSTDASPSTDGTRMRGGDRTLARYVSMTTLAGLTYNFGNRASSRQAVSPKTPTNRRKLVKRSV